MAKNGTHAHIWAYVFRTQLSHFWANWTVIFYRISGVYYLSVGDEKSKLRCLFFSFDFLGHLLWSGLVLGVWLGLGLGLGYRKIQVCDVTQSMVYGTHTHLSRRYRQNFEGAAKLIRFKFCTDIKFQLSLIRFVILSHSQSCVILREACKMSFRLFGRQRLIANVIFTLNDQCGGRCRLLNLYLSSEY